jgi:hypothetical protein
MSRIGWIAIVGVVLSAVPVCAQQPQWRAYSPPVVILGPPVADATPFQGGRYSFYRPGVISSSAYQPSYSVPRTYYPRYPNPGPYYYTPTYSWTPGYYSYYYTPGFFRY